MSIKGLVNLRPKKIPLDGCELWAASPTMGMLLRLEESGDQGNHMHAVREILAKCLVDANGTRVFSGSDDPEIDDLPIEVMNAAVELLTKTGAKVNGSSIEKN